ncbi:two-component response regulator ARR10-like [Apium graveolens]|uniref:two-component response regulator ARR10-like n=1 Tax=Apium graveolens TaxID=4045 RepID=UPI003D7A3087
MEISKLNNQNNGSNNGSTKEKMVTILVVDDDRTSLSLIASLLKGCPYRVFTAKDPLDALRILRTGVIKFDLVVYDVHMPGMDGFELQRWIDQDFQLPVLYSSVNDLHQQTNQTLEILLLVMSGDREASNLCEGSQSGASLFVVKPITTEDMKSIWDFVNQWKKNLAKGKNLVSDDSSAKDNEDDTGNKLYEKKSKRKLQITDNEDHNHGKNRVLKDKAFLTKKNKLNWTPFLHDKFVRAVQHLGPQGSIPRNIVTVMNVPGLRREQVASHLQKYRIDQEKQSEAEQNPDLFKTLQNGKRWSSSFLSHKALPGYGQTKLPINPGFRPSGLTNGTYPSLMYQPQTPEFSSTDKICSGFNYVQTLATIPMNQNGFSKQMQPPNCYTGSGQEVCNTFISQRNLTSSTLDNVLPEQQYEPADHSNLFLDGSTCQSPGKV